MTEIWKDIPGYETRYQASNLGRIKSLTRLVPKCSRAGNWHTRLVLERVLKPANTKTNPHLYVVLGHGTSGKQVHQLVMLAFIGPAPANHDIRHLDGNPLNNNITNLKYGTRTENILDTYIFGGAWRKLNTAQVLIIRNTPAVYGVGARLAKQYGVSQCLISGIRKGVHYWWLQ